MPPQMTKQQMFKMLPQEVMAEAMEKVQQENQLLQGELYARSAPRIGELATALSRLTEAAEQGNAGAKQGLQQFFQIIDKARQAAGGIIIPTVKFQPPIGEDGKPLE